ncbi:MAG: ATP-binding protein [Spirochaetaceae bacterium]|nr:ATP-binding protein [Spirochaetaceae bacterium]
MKRAVRFSRRFLSLVFAAGVFLACSALAYGFLRSQLYANLLLARGRAEQAMSTLFTAMRQERSQEGRFARESFDVEGILEEYPELREKIAGLASYSAAGRLLFRYGEAVPETFSPDALPEDASWRNYIFDEKTKTVNIISFLPAPRRRAHREDHAAFFLFSVRQDDYWTKRRAAWGIFAGVEVLLFAAIWRIRSLLSKNKTYREKLLEQKELVALGTAARTLAHEIKNPLSAIQLQADIIGRVCPEKVTAELQAITQEVGRLRRLTDRVGDFLREPRGMPVPVDLRDFAQGVLLHSGEDAGFSGEKSLWVLIDPDRLHSIIYNLLRNALESGSSPGSVEIRVSRARVPRSDDDGSSGSRAMLEVLDRGAGLSPENAKRVFDPFFTTKSKGSGVGLAIARRFAEAAGGSLEIENREDGGARAVLMIPCTQETENK